MEDQPSGLAETATLGGTRTAGTGGAYLLVIEDGATRLHPLPSPGIVTIGRGPEVELRVEHASVSRRHARIVIASGELRLSDLDSHNGTRVNGVAVDRVRVLVTGDVVAVGEVLLVVHAELARTLPHTILDPRGWRQRLAEEVERAVAFGRPLAVLAIADARPELHAALRTIDVVGQDDEHQLFALLPEADPRAARQLAEVLRGALAAVSPDARFGLASCPEDATDPDNLVLCARAALGAAPPAGIATPADAARRLTFGERDVVICHPGMIRVFELLERLARADLPVLIIGETGVGKENAAYAVHHHSARRGKPFIALNCAAIPDGLVESLLFGHDKGAFTGATGARAGLFETASGGTLFLDEIGELALAVQAKLLRALETKRVTRVGETTERAVDLRVVAATHRVLEDEVRAGRFREDLFFRLGAACVHLPPLRDRRCEIPILFRELVQRAAQASGRTAPVPAPAVLRQLLAYPWPGNVRELKNIAEYLLATVDDDRIEVDDLPPQLVRDAARAAPALPPAAPAGAPMRRLADELDALERQRMVEALAASVGVKTRAAALLGMPIRTFNMKVRQYGIGTPGGVSPGKDRP
jgi:two-component system, NtrC family, response regulator AtoC